MGCSFIASIQNAVGNVADVVAPIAAAIPGPWQIPAMAVMAVTTVQNGGSLGDVVKNVGKAYLLGEIGAGVSGGVGNVAAEAGLEAATAKTIGTIAGNVAKATAGGGDPLAALISGGVGAGVGELTSQIPGFSEMPAAAQKAISTTIAAELQGRDPTQALINQALSAGISAGKEIFNGSQNTTQDGGGTTAAMQGGFGDTADKPVTQAELDEALSIYTPTTDYGINTGGYEISKAGSTEGLTVPANTHTFNEDGTIDYKIADTDAGEETGLQMPTAPSQTDMGGGYGFITPVEGGYMTSLGFVPTDHSQILGDPTSFINDPNVLGKTVIGPDTLRAPLDVTPAIKPSAPVTPAKPPTASPTTPSNPTAPTAGTAGTQTSQIQTSNPTELAEILALYDPFGESIFQAPRASKTPASSLKSAYLLPSSIRAAEGGSIDDLMEYLRN